MSQQRSFHVPILPARTGMSFAILSLARGAAIAQNSQPTDQQPAFRSQSNVVLVPALVKDKSGSIVYGLEAGDFLVEDDGIEQPLRLDDSPESGAGVFGRCPPAGTYRGC